MATRIQYDFKVVVSSFDFDSKEIYKNRVGATIEVDIPGGNAPLTADQAIILTQYLDDAHDDIERLHRVLTNIANAATFNESKRIV